MTVKIFDDREVLNTVLRAKGYLTAHEVAKALLSKDPKMKMQISSETCVNGVRAILEKQVMMGALVRVHNQYRSPVL